MNTKNSRKSSRNAKQSRREPPRTFTFYGSPHMNNVNKKIKAGTNNQGTSKPMKKIESDQIMSNTSNLLDISDTSNISNESNISDISKISSVNWDIKLLTDTARTPERATQGSAGYDIYSDEDITIPAQHRTLVSTGISSAIPEGCYGRILSRSSLAWKYSIDVGAGVIDSDYRGEIKVLLINSSDEDYEVNLGDRIAQMVIQRVEFPKINIVSELHETSREGGFGSTGKR